MMVMSATNGPPKQPHAIAPASADPGLPKYKPMAMQLSSDEMIEQYVNTSVATPLDRGGGSFGVQ